MAIKLEKVVATFYEKLEEGKIMGRKCPKCGNVEFPPVYACNACGSYETEWYEISGKAKVQSPTPLTVENGQCTAVIGWSSKNYDYMKVGDEQIMPLPDTETSTFRIPVRFFDRPMAVIADTVAMSEPHEISYSLRFDSESIEALS